MGRVNDVRSAVDVARLWVEESCAAQGVACKMMDEQVLETVVVLLAAGREGTSAATSA
jgi:hypothetical protein